MSIIHILTVKYKGEMVRYIGYVFTGSALTLIWGLVFSQIANPDNLEKSVEFVLPNGDREFAFPSEVGNRFPYLCWTYAASNLLMSFVASFFVRVSKKTESLLAPNQDSEKVRTSVLKLISSQSKHRLLGLNGNDEEIMSTSFFCDS